MNPQRRAGRSTGQVYHANELARYHSSSESEEDAADAGDDPSKGDADKDKHGQDRHDEWRDPNDDPQHKFRSTKLSRPASNSYSDDTAVATAASDRKVEDPLKGFSIPAKVLLDKNVVTTTFLEQSAAYLRHNPKLVREQDVKHWRNRADIALRIGDAELARKLLQQALLLEIAQKRDDAVERFLKNKDAFDIFIKKSYTTFLILLNRAEDEGLLRDMRREMLIPWARFVQWASGERIPDTLSLPPDSISANWAIEASEDRPPPRVKEHAKHHESRRSVPDMATSAPSYRDPQTYSLPTRQKDENVTSPPAYHTQTRDKDSRLSSKEGPRLSSAKDPRMSSNKDSRLSSYKATGLSSPKDAKARSSELDRRQERRPLGDTTRGSHTVNKISQKSHSRKELYSRSEHDRKHQNLQSVRSASEYEDDDDDNDDNDDEDEMGSEHQGESDEDIEESSKGYIVLKGSPPPHSEPRQMRWPPAPTSGAREPDSTARHKSSAIDASQSSRTTRLTEPKSEDAKPSNPMSRLSRPLIGFVGKKTYRDCFYFCQDNPEIFEEDLTLIPSVIIDLLRQDRDDAADRLMERYIMLKEALKEAYANRSEPMEYMKRLTAVPTRQAALRRNCDAALEDLRRKLKPPASSLSNTVTQERRPSSTSDHRPTSLRALPQSVARRPPEVAKKSTKSYRP